jgi:hypothetical protein
MENLHIIEKTKPYYKKQKKNKNHKKIEKYRQTMYREKTGNRNTLKRETKAKKKTTKQSHR